MKGRSYIPTMATFFPGPTPPRTSGLYVVNPAHIIGAARAESKLSGTGNVKYS